MSGFHFNYLAQEYIFIIMRILFKIGLFAFFVTGCRNSEEQLIKQADKIHSSILTVDTHCDTPMDFSEPDFDLGVNMMKDVLTFRG